MEDVTYKPSFSVIISNLNESIAIINEDRWLIWNLLSGSQGWQGFRLQLAPVEPLKPSFSGSTWKNSPKKNRISLQDWQLSWRIPVVKIVKHEWFDNLLIDPIFTLLKRDLLISYCLQKKFLLNLRNDREFIVGTQPYFIGKFSFFLDM